MKTELLKPSNEDKANCNWPMKRKLNFKADEPTLNGHIYPKDILFKALDKAITEGLPVNGNYGLFSPNIGSVVSYEVEEDGTIILGLDLYPGNILEEIDCDLTTVGHGSVGKDKTIQPGFYFTAVYPSLAELEE